VLNEINILGALDHPNIVKIYEFYIEEENRKCYIVMENLLGGELFTRIVNEKHISEANAVNIMRQLLTGVAFCHSRKIMHMDLKPENILFTDQTADSPIKITDFGSAKAFSKNQKNNEIAGTVKYMAPEVIQKNYNQRCDVWSCGVIMFILLCGRPPFTGKTKDDTVSNIIKGNFEFSDPIWASISEDARNLIRKMLVVYPDDRISAYAALKHSWFLGAHKPKEIDNAIAMETLTHLKQFAAKNMLQKAIFIYISHKSIADKEKNEIIKVFQSLDVNNSGRLSYKELAIGYQKHFGHAISKKEIEKIMNNIDLDKDEFISFSEFATYAVNANLTKYETMMQDAFNSIDKVHWLK
jgi:calcium-dependent protein kinase